MDNPPFALANPSISPLPRRRGRPPGARSKRSIDLARYVEAQFGGMTPGQQSASLCMVTAKEMRTAAADARELQIIDHHLQPVMLAMVVKAAKLARALGCTRLEAWVLLMKERDQLMPYVHQKRATAEEAKPGAALPVAFMIPDEGPRQALPPPDLGSDVEADPLGFVDVSPQP